VFCANGGIGEGVGTVVGVGARMGTTAATVGACGLAYFAVVFDMAMMTMTTRIRITGTSATPHTPPDEVRATLWRASRLL